MDTTTNSTLVDRAIRFAIHAHRGQVRKGPERRPYIVHPLDVLDRLQRHGVVDENTLAAAVLHDVVEDCGVTREQLVEQFGEIVAAVVLELTDDPALSSDDAKDEQVRKAPSYSERACLVKLADKTSNIADLVDHPPGWPPAWVESYVASSRQVVGSLAVRPAALVEEFGRTCARAIDVAREARL